MQKHSKTADLLKVLGGKITSNARPPAPKAGRVSRTAPRTVPKPRPQKRAQAVAASQAERRIVRGRPVQFWLHDEDQKLIQELAVWLLSQRKRINGRRVGKTVLRAAKTGPDLLVAYDEAVKIDGRLPRRAPGANTA